MMIVYVPAVRSGPVELVDKKYQFAYRGLQSASRTHPGVDLVRSDTHRADGVHDACDTVRACVVADVNRVLLGAVVHERPAAQSVQRPDVHESPVLGTFVIALAKVPAEGVLSHRIVLVRNEYFHDVIPFQTLPMPTVRVPKRASDGPDDTPVDFSGGYMTC